MVSKQLIHHICQEINHNLGLREEVLKYRPLYGGSINDSYCLETLKHKYFIKINFAGAYSDVFEKEAKGLELIQLHSTFEIPEIIAIGRYDEYVYLVLSFLDSLQPNKFFWENFGRNLANMHQKEESHYGLDYNNYIGSLIQKNDKKTNWTDFYRINRIEFQIRLAIDAHKLDPSYALKIDTLFSRVQNIFPEEPPSLLHGDLWSGNFMVNNNGEATIFDPAVYFGHREMDIAMTHLFGGFHSRFYNAYMEEFPLEKQWEERIDLCNLYPLLVHVNLFGSSYSKRVENIINRYL